MPTGMMIPARHMPPMMGRGPGGAGGFGSTSSGLILGQHNLLELEMDHKQQQQHQHQHLSNGGHHPQQQQQLDILQQGAPGASGQSDLAARMMRLEDQELDSNRSGSENAEGAVSGDDLQDPASGGRPSKKKRYHRHTQHQIQEMEAFFKQCPHPDDKQRKELSRELGLEPLQVKFWFQNKRTQMKNQHERNENSLLRAENEKLRAENMRYKDALANASCPNCGGPAALGEMSFDEHHLRIENARLREEIDRISGIAAKYVGKPVTSYPFMSPPPPLPPPQHRASPSISDLGPAAAAGMVSDALFGTTASDLLRGVAAPPHSDAEKPVVIELAVAAMEELVRMAQLGEPLWVDGGRAGGELVLNEEEYVRAFPRGIGPRPFGLKSEASRDSAVVIMNHVNLVEILMDVNQWSTVFSGIVSKGITVEVLSTGVAGNYNGALQVMSAEFQVPSPLVPTRESYFVRYCKQHGDGMWAVVDVSLDSLRPSPVMRCRRRPSGCLIREMPNGYSKVTWVEHVEVDDRSVHDIYKQLVNSGLAFGAKRWVATLERQCERLASVMASNIPAVDLGVLSNPEGRRSMLKLAERMVMSFCNGVSASTAHQWTTLSGSGGDDVRVMTRKSIDDPGRPPGIVLSAATSFWLPVSPKRVFDFLRDEHSRSEWDILSNGGLVQEMTHIANGREQGNCVSLLRVNSANSSQSNMLILQESCTDATGSYVVYAPVDVVAMNVVLNGGDPDYVALLPSGFAILPDSPASASAASTLQNGGLNGGGAEGEHDNFGGGTSTGGSLLTVAFQILVDSVPTAKLSLGSVATVNSLISCTVDRIKAAVGGAGTGDAGTR